MSDAPIEPENFIAGVKVVDIGDLRVARGRSRRERSACPHRQLIYDNQERRIWCEDCQTTVEPFDAFIGLVERFYVAEENIKRRQKAVAEAEAFSLRSRASKAMDEMFGKRSSVPCCPKCNYPLMPERVVLGLPSMGRNFAQKYIESEEKKNGR